MADDDVPTTEETVDETEVEAHSGEILGLQAITVDDAAQAGFNGGVSAGSCSSCVGSYCM